MSSLHSRRAPKLEPKPKSKQTKTNLKVKGPGPGGILRKTPNNLIPVESSSTSGAVSSKSSFKPRCALKQKTICGVVLVVILFLYIKFTSMVGGGSKDLSAIRSFLRHKHFNTDARDNINPT